MYFEDFYLGQTFSSPRLQVNEREILDFGWKFDPQPMHTDPEAARDSMFDGLIASGFHTAALCIKLAMASHVFDKCSLCGIGIDQLRWMKPLRPGTWVQLHFTAIHLQLEINSRRGRATFKHCLSGDDGILMQMDLMMLLKCRNHPDVLSGI